jgi:dihydroorotase
MGSGSNAPSARKTIDASGLVVLPGVIDVHVHMRDPGSTYKEDFRSGTASAAAGGVTTVFDMPNNSPPTTGVDAFRAKAEEASEKALVDYGLFGGLARGNSREILPLVREGAIGFKWYMAETTGNLPTPSEPELLGDLSALAKARRRLAVHAEDDSLVREGVSSLRSSGRRDAAAHYESRPAAVEVVAVRRALGLARESGCDIHIAHASSAGGAMEVRKAKHTSGVRRGGVTAETCPHYLLLDEADYARKGSMMKVNPAVKTARDRLALWRAVNDGTIDMIATDHAPHALSEKTDGDSIFDRASGFPGLETSVALMLTSVARGLLSLTRYVRLTSEGPARAWGIYPKKGGIAIGSDADFTIVDTRKEWTIDASRFESKAKYSPFDGSKVKGAAVYTVVRGSVVMDHGEIDATCKGELQRPLDGRRGR